MITFFMHVCIVSDKEQRARSFGTSFTKGLREREISKPRSRMALPHDNVVTVAFN
jgi:hypothetical protein